MERWAQIEGFEGRYEVSDLGRVRNMRTGRVLKPTVCTNLYLRVSLGRNNMRLVHRLVAHAFVPGDASLDVNHLDYDRAHNDARNLEWVSKSANHKHAHQKASRKAHAAKEPILVGGVRYESHMAAAEALGVVVGSITSAVRRNHRTCGMEVQRA